MQPTNPMQPRGSFVKPQAITKAVEQAESPASLQPPAQQAVQAPEAPPLENPKDTEEQARAAQIEEIKKNIEKDLEVQLSNEDINTYLFKGVLAKEVTIIPGRMKGTFTTLRIKEIQEIDARMSEIRNEGKNTQQGWANEESIIALAYSWTHAAGRPLGLTATEREKKIRDMGALFIETASTARTRLDTLLRICMNDSATIKK